MNSLKNYEGENWSGVWTALCTPFFQGKIDFGSLESLIANQLRDGVQGFVVCGTTGESMALSESERRELVAFVMQASKKSAVPIVVGCTSCSLSETKKLAFEAQSMGAAGVLIAPPPYTRPPQRGLIQYFKEIASSVQIPMMLYNIPTRSAVGLEKSTLVELFKENNIRGLKEASGNLVWDKELFQELHSNKDLHLKSMPRIFSGDDGSYVDFKKMGGHGIVSVASHLHPQSFLQMNEDEISALVNLLAVDVNPIGIKAALFLLGRIRSDEMRLPLSSLAPEVLKKLKVAIDQVGFLRK